MCPIPRLTRPIVICCNCPLQDELAEAEPVMRYKCISCKKMYSSMDAMHLYDFTDNK